MFIDSRRTIVSVRRTTVSVGYDDRAPASVRHEDDEDVRGNDSMENLWIALILV